MMPTQTIRLRVQAHETELSVTDRKVAEFVLANPRQASRMTISEMSAALGVADSSVTKFTKRIGYAGFREFRTELLSEGFDPAISINENVVASDSALVMAQKVFDSTASTIAQTKALLDGATLSRAAEVITGADRISFFGVGGSSSVAADAFHKFLRSPIPAQQATDYHVQLMLASSANPGSAAIVFSHTGLTTETSEITRILAKRGCPYILVTSNPTSPMAAAASCTLITSADETGYRDEALSSRISQLVYVDALYTIAMFDDEEASRKSLLHVRNAIDPHRC